MWHDYLCPAVHYWCDFGENLLNTFRDIVLTSHKSAVSCTFNWTVTSTFDFLTPKCATWFVNLCSAMHRRRKFGENPPTAFGHIVLTVSGCKQTWAHRQMKTLRPRSHYTGLRPKTVNEDKSLDSSLPVTQKTRSYCHAYFHRLCCNIVRILRNISFFCFPKEKQRYRKPC